MHRKRVSDLFSMLKLMLAIALLSSIAPAYAQLSTGKIEGFIRDQDTGQPLAGAQVVVEGTRLGNIANDDGYYFILNVPPGRRSISFSYTGYQKLIVADRLILAGQTHTVDATLSSSVIQLEGIVVDGASELLVPRDNTVTKHRLTSETIMEAPATNLEDLLAYEAGVQLGGGGGLARGLRIRGGRLGEEVMVVDGMAVRNYTADPYRSGLGWIWEHEAGSLGEDTNPLEFSVGSVEEVDIITGGFQAEYGNAQSGIINIVTKEGGLRHNGNVRYTSDQANPRSSDYGYNQLQTSFGGPVPLVPGFFYHGSGEIQGIADQTPTHAGEGFRGFDQEFVDRLNESVRNDSYFGLQSGPVYTLEQFRTGKEFYGGQTGTSKALFSPANPVRQPNNWRDRSLASGKLTYSPIQVLKFLGSGNFSRVQRSYPGDYFRTGIVSQGMMPSRDWENDADTVMYMPQSVARRTRVTNMLAGFDWNLFQSASRNAALQFRYSNFRN